MKNDYVRLINKIEEMVLITDDISNYSQSILEDKTIPIIDRAYFSHIFNLFYFYWNGLSDTIEQITNIKDLDEKERIKYLLTNLPDEAGNVHT